MIYHNVADIFTEITDARARLCEGMEGLNPQQAAFKPVPDTWSITEILEHLSKVDRALVTRIGKMLAELEEAAPEVKACTGFVPFSMESIAERARDQKFKSPEPALPTSGLSIDESLARLQA